MTASRPLGHPKKGFEAQQPNPPTHFLARSRAQPSPGKEDEVGIWDQITTHSDC